MRVALFLCLVHTFSFYIRADSDIETLHATTTITSEESAASTPTNALRPNSALNDERGEKPGDYSQTPHNNVPLQKLAGLGVSNLSRDKASSLQQEFEEMANTIDFNPRFPLNSRAAAAAAASAAPNETCPMPRQVIEIPTYVLVRNNLRLMKISMDMFAGFPIGKSNCPGFAFLDLQESDKGKNKNSALQIEFEVPYDLVAIYFPVVDRFVSKYSVDRFIVAFENPSLGIWQFVKRPDTANVIRVFHYLEGANFNLPGKVKFVRIYPETWGTDGARVPLPEFYTCVSRNIQDILD